MIVVILGWLIQKFSNGDRSMKLIKWFLIEMEGGSYDPPFQGKGGGSGLGPVDHSHFNSHSYFGFILEIN